MTRQKKTVKHSAGREEKVLEEWAALPGPQSMAVLVKATKQKGHLGSKVNTIPVNKPMAFFGLIPGLLFVQGPQSSLSFKKLITTKNYYSAILLRISWRNNRPDIGQLTKPLES